MQCIEAANRVNRCVMCRAEGAAYTRTRRDVPWGMAVGHAVGAEPSAKPAISIMSCGLT